MKRWRITFVVIALVLLLAEASMLSLVTGSSSLSAGEAVRILVSPLFPDAAVEASPTEIVIVREVRLPRFLLAFLVGAALAVSGTIMQALFQNPMADPSIIGVSAGAALGAVASLIILPAGLSFLGMSILPWAAFVGALGVTALVYVLSRRGGRTPVGLLLLTGIAVGSLCSAATSLILIRGNQGQVTDMVTWTMGSVSFQSMDHVLLILPYAIVGSMVAYLYARDLNALLLGDEQAAYLGIAVERVKFILLGVGALLAAAAVAVAGIVGFVGLVVPHLMRILVGPDHRVLLPTSFLAGGLVVVLAAMASNLLGGMPLGIITALLGAPFFLYLLHRQKAYRF
jgi:iron complex transport system permease protein